MRQFVGYSNLSHTHVYTFAAVNFVKFLHSWSVRRSSRSLCCALNPSLHIHRIGGKGTAESEKSLHLKLHINVEGCLSIYLQWVVSKLYAELL